MIEDKKIGLKIAENHNEEIWHKVAEARKANIQAAKDTIMIEEVFLKAAERELKNAAK